MRAIVEDALRDGSLACVIAQARSADMTATRRLQLATSDEQPACSSTLLPRQRGVKTDGLHVWHNHPALWCANVTLANRIETGAKLSCERVIKRSGAPLRPRSDAGGGRFR